DIVAPFILKLGSETQKQRWLPGFCTGEALGAIAMTEPRSGSDIQGMQTKAERAGMGFVLHGEKTHISNGSTANVIIVAAQSSKGAIGAQGGISLLLVEDTTPGLTRNRIAKAGMAALDTSHLRFDGCEIPAANLLGGEGMGFLYLMTFLGIERLVLAIYAQAFAVGILQDLIAACHRRASAAGTVLDFQNTQFRLADLYADAAANQAFVDQCIALQLRGRADPRAACIAKLRTTETLKAVAAIAVQLRGAAGVSGPEGQSAAQDLIDASVQSIWGGTSEVMRDVIGRSLVNSL
ncbi:MAG: acyl-CoA dehydrogenase family protein, partial [Paracoccaceae bacterium]